MRGECLYMLNVYIQGGIPSGTIPATGGLHVSDSGRSLSTFSYVTSSFLYILADSLS